MCVEKFALVVTLDSYCCIWVTLMGKKTLRKK